MLTKLTPLKLALSQYLRRLKLMGPRHLPSLTLPLLLTFFVGIGTIVLLITLNSTPHAPRLKKGTGNVLYRASNQVYAADIGTRDGSPTVNFQVDKSNATFTLAGIGKGEGKKDGRNSVLYQEIMPSVDLKYTTLDNGLKEELILKAPPQKHAEESSNVFLFDLEFTGTIPKVLASREDGGLSISPTFYGDGGEYLFHFEEPFAVDAAGARTDNVLVQIGEDRQVKDKYYLKLILDPTWLTDPSRVYPITLDPTIVHDTTTEFSAGTLNRVKDTGSGSSPLLSSYYQELVADEYTAGLWHMDEISGTNVADSSGNGNTGTATGTTIVATKLDKGRSFPDATTDYVNIPSTMGLTNSSITLEAWINLDSTSENGAFIKVGVDSGGTSTSNGFGLGVGSTTFEDSGNELIMIYEGVRWIDTGVNIGTGWHHVAMVVDNGGIPHGYIDGKLIGTYPGTSGITPTGGNSRIGGYYGSGATNRFVDAEIDEVRVSNIARSAEEIKASASRRPSAVYTSEVLDLSNPVTTWNSLSWDEWGVATGDGETLSSTTGLIAQWNFNETSGTTANVAAGTCGASCNGTLSNFDSTASQDADPDSSWTANNRRWGTGALQFDATDSFVDLGSSNAFNLSNTFTIESWFQAHTNRSDYRVLVSKGPKNTGHFETYLSSSNGTYCFFSNDINSGTAICTPQALDDNVWHHTAVTYNGTNLVIYVDGIAVTNTATSGSITSETETSYLGKQVDTGSTSMIWSGTIDSTRIYNRTLPAHEIVSNYNSANIELQTRVGDDTSPNDGDWDDWSPSNTEYSLDDFDDSTYLYSTTETGLIAYWPMEETSANSCPNGGDVCDVIHDAEGLNTNTDLGNGVYGRGTSYNYGSTNIASNEYLTLNKNHTVEFWAKLNKASQATSWLRLVGKGLGNNRNYGIFVENDGDILYQIYGSTGTNCNYYDNAGGTGDMVMPFDGSWHHLVATYDGEVGRFYKDGQLVHSSSCVTTPLTNDDHLYFGYHDSHPDGIDGALDEVRLYRTTLSADTIQEHYLKGSTSSTFLHPSADTIIKQEGTKSLKLETGKPQLEGNVFDVWHLDETNGDLSGNDIFGISEFNIDGEINGTNLATGVVNGVSGKARAFNGTDDYINFGDVTNFDGYNTMTISLWVKPDAFPADYSGIIAKADFTTPGNSFFIRYEASQGIRGAFNDAEGDQINCDSGAGVAPPIGKWTLITAVLNGTSCYLYFDDVQKATGTNASFGTTRNTTTSFKIGGSDYVSEGYFDGAIDEVKITGRSATATEVAEMYRSGRGHTLNREISASDLSTLKSLPFYIAADRPGTYLDLTVGESAYANYLPDDNTVALWHLEEGGGSGAYMKDSSGLGNNGTPTGTTTTKGMLGNGRYFDGSSDFISIPDSPSLSSASITIDAWVKFGAFSTDRLLAGKGGEVWMTYGGSSWGCGSNKIGFMIYNGGWVSACSTTTPVLNKWYHVTGVHNGSSISLYINGQLEIASVAATTPADRANPFDIGDYSGGGYALTGHLDEVRVSNIARTAEEIRQAYEVGLRTHPVTIDFTAVLNSGNLITGSGDTSFTVDATAYGLSQMGSALYQGDKVIVRENYNGTEYIAQGTVSSVTASSGAVTVASWDSGSTFPSGGYTASADVFKWQREYFQIEDNALSSHMNGITNLTYRLTAGGEGRTIWLDDLKITSGYLTTKGGSSITSTTGSRYLQYRAIMTSLDEAVSATLSAVTLDYSGSTIPNTPSLDTPTDTATSQSLTPALKTTATDADSDYLRYKIELCENVGMTTNCSTFDQTSSQTGWSGQDAQTSTAYASGTQATYTLQTALSPATTYYWRSYTTDPGGTNIWSNTQGTPYSFTTNATPTIPSLDLPTDTATDQVLAPALKTTATDADSDYLRYKIELCDDAAMTIYCQTFDQTSSQTGWSGQDAQTSTAYASGTQATYTPQTNLKASTTYYWRSYVIDPAGNNAWTSTQAAPYSFTTTATPTLASGCRIEETKKDTSLTVVWADLASDEDNYTIDRSVDGGAWVNLVSGLAAGTTSYEDSTITTSHTYRYRIAPYYTGPVYGDWCYTDTLSVYLGTFKFENIKFQ